MGVTNLDMVQANQFIGPASGSTLPATTGKYFYVNSGIGSNGNDGRSPASPLATVDVA